MFESTADIYKSLYGKVKTETIKCPASLIFLGDHTHYTDGILLASAVNKYVELTAGLREDDKIEFSSVTAENGVRTSSLEKYNYWFIGDCLKTLAVILKEEGILTSGINCVMKNEIPLCLGLGTIPPHLIAFIEVINKLFHLGLSSMEVTRLSQKAEYETIGKISNRAHHYTVTHHKPGFFTKIDLKMKEIEHIDFPVNEYEVIVFDTQKKIINSRDICNQRIEECDVGIQGLKLYMWGIKSMRDIGRDFLEKHIHMIPRRVYNRCYFNVSERERVDYACQAIENQNIDDFSPCIFESHRFLKEYYDLDYKELDLLITAASESGLSHGSKIISCSTIKSTLNLVKTENAENFIEQLKTAYEKKYRNRYNVHRLKFSKTYMME